jgi:protoheme IX farnesyltransferase
VKNARAEAVAVPLAAGRRYSVAGDYLALAKPRLNFLVVATSAAGYYLGVPSAGSTGYAASTGLHLLPMAGAVIGTALVAGGAAVLNQVYERDTDALMRRTRMRPLPDGRVSAADARLFGVLLAAAGIVSLTIAANVLAALLAVLTIVVYLFVYTPMKRRSPASTLIGAVPGALPPLIGWTAAYGSISTGGLALFAIVFLWQIPHFMAIAWMYRDDYRQAGFPMLPVIEPDGKRTGLHAVVYATALLPVSLVPAFVGVTGSPYFWIALALSLALLWLSARFALLRTDASARRLFFGSIVYLPLIWIAMVVFH